MDILNQELSLKNITEAIKGIGKKKAKNSYTVKTTINFIGVDEGSDNYTLAVPLIITIIICAVLISKFAVADRYKKLWEKEAYVASLEAQLEDGMEEIGDASELSDKFYHYTYSTMSDEEKNRVSRVDIASLISYIGQQGQSVNSYSIKDDTLTVDITAPTLSSISRLVGDLKERDIVESASVQMAQTGSTEDSSQGVEAEIIIYIAGEDENEE